MSDAKMPPRCWLVPAYLEQDDHYIEKAKAIATRTRQVMADEQYLSLQEHESLLHAARKEAEDARAKAFEEIGDWLNVAHTSRPDLFPPFDNEAAWGGANHFKVYAANALWKMAEEIRAPAPSQPASGAGEGG